MAKRVTISVPDVLHEKMKEWRESFNLSKMFQDALSDAIQKKEEIQRRIQEDKSISDVIERLRSEKIKSEGNYFENGRRDGVIWSKAAHYDDLVYAVSWEPGSAPLKDGIVGEYLSNAIEKDRLMIESDSGLNEHACAYIDGFRRGVADFWEKIKDKL